jgi:hypothetical protein
MGDEDGGIVDVAVGDAPCDSIVMPNNNGIERK